jgi:hypothetical protein
LCFITFLMNQWIAQSSTSLSLWNWTVFELSSESFAADFPSNCLSDKAAYYFSPCCHNFDLPIAYYFTVLMSCQMLFIAVEASIQFWIQDQLLKLDAKISL